MIKKLSFSLYFICFFGFIVYAYGSQLKNTFENQLLSSIYSEYNNDYLIWEKLPKYNFSNDHTSTLLSNIIIGNYTFDNISEIESGFIHEIVLFLKNLGDDKCLNTPDKKQIYIFEEAILKSINFWMNYCNKNNVQNNLENLNEIDSRFTNLRYINTILAGWTINALKNIIVNSGDLDKKKVLAYICGDNITSDLDLQLQKEGFQIEKIINYTSEKIKELNADTNNLINDHPPDIIFVYSKRSAESFIDLAKKYSLNGLMTGSRVMCISEKVINVFKEAGWKNLETFEAGDELIKIGN